MSKINFIIILCLLLLGACTLPNKYKLAKNRYNINTDIYKILDTNCVYVNKYFYYHSGGLDSVYYFKRFFGNGKVFLSKSFKNEPTIADFNNMNYGQKAYYDITKEGFLRYESYMDGLDGYDYFYAKIYNDSIVTFLHKTQLFFGAKDNVHYVEYKINVNLNRFNTDDWINRSFKE